MAGPAWRVHVAAFGFSRPDHVIAPLKVMRADRFFLLENENDRAYKYHLEGKEKVDVHKLLNDTDIPWEKRVVDLWSPAAVGRALRELVAELDGNPVTVNASVGPNTVAVGATLASFFAPVRLFHPGGAKPDEPLKRFEDVRWIPRLSVPDWDDKHVAVLDSLLAHGGEASGSDVKEHLRQHHPEVIGSGRVKAKNWAQSEHGRFQPLVDFLETSGAIEVERGKRRWLLRVTPSGREMAELLG